MFGEWLRKNCKKGEIVCIWQSEKVFLVSITTLTAQDIGVEVEPDDIEPISQERDPLFEQAKWGVQHKTGGEVSAIWLKAHLDISYGRASALIDQLEAAGIISAPDPKTHRRTVL